MIISLKNEILIRNRELKDKKIESIYFGGGTPSVLSTLEINSLIQTVFDNYIINDSVEITLEANPDDLSHEKILELNGVGFRANLKGENLNLQIGFSHDINFKIPKDIKITVEKQTTIKKVIVQ